LDQVWPGNCARVFLFHETSGNCAYSNLVPGFAEGGLGQTPCTARMKIKFTGGEVETTVAESLPPAPVHGLTPDFQPDSSHQACGADRPLRALLSTQPGTRTWARSCRLAPPSPRRQGRCPGAKPTSRCHFRSGAASSAWEPSGAHSWVTVRPPTAGKSARCWPRHPRR